jgi:hypothetical protein
MQLAGITPHAGQGMGELALDQDAAGDRGRPERGQRQLEDLIDIDLLGVDAVFAALQL